MASILALINRLLPFATAGTPLAQDIIHLAAICGALYFAPQLQQWYQKRQVNGEHLEPPNGEPAVLDAQRVPDPARVEDDANQPDLEPNHEENGPRDLEEDVQAAEEDEPIQPGQPGPANAHAATNTRNVGAKKAKSMARRDQQRAYHEFQRSQGDAQRAKDAEGAAEREAVLSAERERRKATEAALDAKKAKEREKKREQDRKEREDEIRRRDLAVAIVRDELQTNKISDLFKVALKVGGDVDEEWVEKILRASGMIGRKDDQVTMITSMGWAVRVSEGDMIKVYSQVLEQGASDDTGRIENEVIGATLEKLLQAV